MLVIVFLSLASGYAFYRMTSELVFAIFFTFGMMGISASWLRNRKKQ
jgi:hypothetical protein